MKVYVVSDIHFSHKNILKYCSHRMKSSFIGDVNDMTAEEITEAIDIMNEHIIKNWNSLVSKEDNVFILGDVAMGQIKDAPALISQLNGNKILILGNHDKTLKKLIKSNDGLSNLFVSMYDYYEYSHIYNGKKIMICMSHYPMRFWNSKNQGTLMLHGHLHGSPCDVPGRIKDVGLDTNNLFPYLLDNVIEELLKIEFMEEHHKD